MSAPKLLQGLLDRVAPPDTPASGFSRAAIDEEEVRTLLTAAQVAPSADNAQIWRFVSVTSATAHAQLAAAVAPVLRASVEAAPLVLVACGVRALVTRTRREQPFALIDVPIAVTHIVLQAAELDLACAWTLDVDEAVVRQALAIPEEVRVVALLALG